MFENGIGGAVFWPGMRIGRFVYAGKKDSVIYARRERKPWL
jgi:hypothetical protein